MKTVDSDQMTYVTRKGNRTARTSESGNVEKAKRLNQIFCSRGPMNRADHDTKKGHSSGSRRALRRRVRAQRRARKIQRQKR